MLMSLAHVNEQKDVIVMGFSIYLSLSGQRQGSISAGCNTKQSIGNKCQLSHIDQISVFEVNYGIAMQDNKSLIPLTIRKPIDKSSPLLFQAVNDNEELDCEFDFYRTDSAGMQVIYYKVRLKKSHITELNIVHPHSLQNENGDPEEIVTFQFDTISIEHVAANTTGWAAWKNEG